MSPSFYGFRWLTLLMTQEFDLPDVLRLWDSLLSDSRRFLQEGSFDRTLTLTLTRTRTRARTRTRTRT